MLGHQGSRKLSRRTRQENSRPLPWLASKCQQSQWIAGPATRRSRTASSPTSVARAPVTLSWLCVRRYVPDAETVAASAARGPKQLRPVRLHDGIEPSPPRSERDMLTRYTNGALMTSNRSLTQSWSARDQAGTFGSTPPARLLYRREGSGGSAPSAE